MPHASARYLHAWRRAGRRVSHASKTNGGANMNTYSREIRGMLENLGVIRRPRATWTSGFMVGAGLGVIAGAAVAALLTPTDGKEMRILVRSKAKYIAGSAEKKIAAIKGAHANGTREQMHA
jgi:hypothetical protein